MPDIRVLIISDDPLARAGLVALLAAQPGCLVIGRVASGDDLSTVDDIYRPDLLVWDLGAEPMPALERLTTHADTLPPVLALLPDAMSARAAWRAGARGILPRDVNSQQLTAALAALVQGLALIERNLASEMWSQDEQEPLMGSAQDATPLVEALTPRELAVLRLLADGLPNKAIAQHLMISEHTVKFHINAILGKLGAASRTEAVVRATRLGLILL